MFDAPLAVLDANVLYREHARSLLLFMAERGLFVPLWSTQVWDEVRRNLVRNQVITPEAARRLEDALRRAFPEAWGRDFAGAAGDVELPDEDDRHVIDLAVKYEATHIVTQNARHFPAPLVRSRGIVEISLPDFFSELTVHGEPSEVLAAAEEHRKSLTRTGPEPHAYLGRLFERLDEFGQLPVVLEMHGFVDMLRAPAARSG